nr:FAD-dependent monooxygenase [Nocardioides convexus]
MLSHLLHVAGIESVVVETRTRHEIENTHRAGILERDSVRLLVDSGVSDRVLREGHEHQGDRPALRRRQPPHRLRGTGGGLDLALPADRCLRRPGRRAGAGRR